VVDAEQQSRTRQFVEEQGLLWEGSGLPRIAGRILGWLLICQPAEQTAADLAGALAASKGSISTNTRLLLQLGIIERTSRLGQRAVLFRIAPGAWGRFVRNEQSRVTLFREGAERGLALLEDVPDAERTRLEEFRDLFAFIEREYPLLLEHYEQWRKNPESR
jgi:DNA-binding transcriptional regulator GbsR (MarR family)